MCASNKRIDRDAVGFTVFEVSIGLLLGFLIGIAVFAAGYFLGWWS